MTKYVALLRGIAPLNPNMRNEKLREVFEELGYNNVQTVISSGNVLFDLPAGRQQSSVKNINQLEETIEVAIQKQLGFFSTTIIRSQAELLQLVNKQPFKGLSHSPKTNLNVTFLKKATKLKFKLPYQVENRAYSIVKSYDRAICSVIDISGAKTPDLMTWLEKQFGKEITTRTWKTVERILKKMDESSS